MRYVAGVWEQVGQPQGDGGVVVHGHLRGAGCGAVVRRSRLHEYELGFHEVGSFDGIGRRGIDIAHVNVGFVRVCPVPLVTVVVARVAFEPGCQRTSRQQAHQSDGEDHEPQPSSEVKSNHSGSSQFMVAGRPGCMDQTQSGCARTT